MQDKQINIEDKVVDWLSKEGYRLEYIVHKAFSDIGLTTVMSNHFETSEGKWREIDVTAVQMPVGELAKSIAVRVMCECKYSADNPWVLLQSALQSNLWCDWISLPQSPSVKELSRDIENYATHLYRSWHFAKGQLFAHNLVQAFREKNRDMAFDSLQKISNAAWDYVETPFHRGHSAYLIAIPALIVEAPIYSAWFDHRNSKFVVKEIKYGRLSWSGCRGGTAVDVVHTSAINDYASAIRLTFEILLYVLADLLSKSNQDT